MHLKNLFNPKSYGAAWSYWLYHNLQDKKQFLKDRVGLELSAKEKQKQKDAIKHVYEHARLTLVSPDSKAHKSIREKLVSAEGRDKVHPLETMEELVDTRLGTENDNKRTYALTLDLPGCDPVVLAVIYTHWSVQGHDAFNVNEAALPGNVADILAEPSQALEQEADTGIFYSISSFFPGAGGALIKALRTHLGGDAEQKLENSKQPVLSTLSPMRGFGKWLTTQDDDIPAAPDMRAAFLKAAATEYLDENIDAVQGFHMGNGAYIGKVNLDANDAGTKDAQQGLGVMINYVYPQGRMLDENKSEYKTKGVLKRAPSL